MCKNSNFENFESTLYSTSGSVPLISSTLEFKRQFVCHFCTSMHIFHGLFLETHLYIGPMSTRVDKVSFKLKFFLYIPFTLVSCFPQFFMSFPWSSAPCSSTLSIPDQHTSYLSIGVCLCYINLQILEIRFDTFLNIWLIFLSI